MADIALHKKAIFVKKQQFWYEWAWCSLKHLNKNLGICKLDPAMRPLIERSLPTFHSLSVHHTMGEGSWLDSYYVTFIKIRDAQPFLFIHSSIYIQRDLYWLLSFWVLLLTTVDGGNVYWNCLVRLYLWSASVSFIRIKTTSFWFPQCIILSMNSLIICKWMVNIWSAAAKILLLVLLCDLGKIH